MSGLGAMVSIQWRTARRTVLVWVLVLVASMAGTAVSIAGLYDTPDKVASYGEAVVGDALVALNGRVEGIDTFGGIIQDEFGFMAAFLMPLFGIALLARLTRREEESGRLETLLAGRVDRRAPVLAALLVMSGAVAVTVVGFAVSLILAGVPTSGSVLYAVALGLLTLVFASLAALLAQVLLHSRGVYAGALAVLALSYLLRGVGDVKEAWLTWLSPLGWMEKAAPFGPQRWWALLVPLVVSLALSGAAVLLAGRRDLGSALYRPGPGPARAGSLLQHPVGLAAYVHRSSFAGWLVGSLALAATMGLLAQEAVDALLGNPGLTDLLTSSGGDPVDGFLSLTQIYLAVIGCGYVVQSFGALRTEETGGRLEPQVAGVVSRWRWLGAHVAVVLVGLVAIIVLSALAFGATTAISTGNSGYVVTLLGAGLAFLPAELVIAGIALALFGTLPRAYAGAWAAFGATTFIAFLGAGLQMPDWLLDLAPTTHVGTPPQGAVDATSLVVLTLVAAALVVVAFAGFRRRLVPQG